MTQTLQKIDPSKFKQGRDLIQTTYENIWRQFGINSKSKRHTKEFRWTSSCREQFYKHNFHYKAISLITEREMLLDWISLCEPQLIK